MIANLANIPGDPRSLAHWSFTNMAHHRDINREIYRVYEIALPEYILDPFLPQASDNFLYAHQIMHNNMNAVLGISGYNLRDVDWNDEGQLASWISLHFNEHYQANQILGV